MWNLPLWQCSGRSLCAASDRVSVLNVDCSMTEHSNDIMDSSELCVSSLSSCLWNSWQAEGRSDSTTCYFDEKYVKVCTWMGIEP